MVHEFETLNPAASALLIETCALLNERRLGYVVAGGWGPLRARAEFSRFCPTAET